MPKLRLLRTQAFHAQHGRCTYCGAPMWLESPTELQPLGLRVKTATLLRCTAEHLIARQDGGKNVEGNVAAACWSCNSRRHNRKSPPPPDAYRAYVKRRMAKGKWVPPVVFKLVT